ncbi:MAG: hypothetical protein ACRDJH_21460 [Thermomicrobiales bacterium]
MRDAIEWLGGIRVDNLADFGVLADTIEVIGAIVMMLGGIYITHRIQKWADSIGEHPSAVNTGRAGAPRYEAKTYRE